jgi:hypothetical protein
VNHKKMFFFSTAFWCYQTQYLGSNLSNSLYYSFVK